MEEEPMQKNLAEALLRYSLHSWDVQHVGQPGPVDV